MTPAGTSQLGLPGMGFENRSLFTEHFLEERLPRWETFRSIDPSPCFLEFKDLWDREKGTIATANESQTEDRLIQPILDILGFERTVQPNARLETGRRIPDYALFTSREDRQVSEQSEGLGRFLSAAALAEAKRIGTPLDKRGAGGTPQEDPEAQILDYMWRTRVAWAILTNGREWRLYGQAGDLVEAAHFSIPDLPALIEAEDLEQLRYFLAFFRAESFRPDESGKSFLEQAFAESEANARMVGDSLRDQVFDAVPKIATGLLGDDERTEDALERAFSNALVILYRLLFCLYAESRDLLPVRNPAYSAHGLRHHRDQILDSSNHLIMQSSRLFSDMEILFNLVDEGNEDLGINQYNGGLFAEDNHPWLEGRSVPDPLMRDALASLYAVDGASIDYRDLSIRHLGTMYEQLLEHKLGSTDRGLELIDAQGRHESGSYFTPESIVDAIVERTLDPILTSVSTRLQTEEVSGEEAVNRFLDLAVCDPAMGSGHFLVSAATYISRFIATDPTQEGLEIDELAIRRQVTERCLYGVDLNPMAVELAKLALWLSTVDGSRPLTFLSNLRTGNSLIGADIDSLRRDIGYWNTLREGVGVLIERDSEIQGIPSEDADDVHEKEEIANAISRLRHDLEQFANSTIEPSFSETPEAYFHWEIEFPEVFFDEHGELIPGGGFDAIVGNPPYVRNQEVQPEVAAWCRNKYRTAFRRFDLYVVFIERGLDLLKSGGQLGFIVPNKFMKLDFGERLRQLLSERSAVREIVDFGDIQVFDGAVNYTCILSLVSSRIESIKYVRLPSQDHTPLPAEIDRAKSERFDASTLSGDPWILLSTSERTVWNQIHDGADSLDSCTKEILQGLITGADQIFIVEDKGQAPEGRRVYSHASECELMLEPELLHPLSSGPDVDRWAMKPLTNLLLFPYREEEGTMRLLSPNELQEYPLAAQYLHAHQETLAARANGPTQDDDWYRFVRPRVWDLHNSPKLGVAATVTNLEVAPDAPGGMFFHNVRVHGILPSEDGPDLWTLLALLNSRTLDWVFRRSAAELANGHFQANRQFIAPLPIKLPTTDQAEVLGTLGREIHHATVAVNTEKSEFKAWLESQLQVDLSMLRRHTHLDRYPDLGLNGILEILRENRNEIGIDPSTRIFRELLRGELDSSLRELAAANREISVREPELESLVFELYGLSQDQRTYVNADYD